MQAPRGWHPADAQRPCANASAARAGPGVRHPQSAPRPGRGSAKVPAGHPDLQTPHHYGHPPRLQALPGPSPAYPGHSQQARLHQAPGQPRWLPSQCPSPPLTPFLSPPVPGCCAHLCWPGHKHLRTWGALALLRARAQSLPLTGHGPRAYVTSSLSLCLFIRTKRSV